jgi:hypothetical protein
MCFRLQNFFQARAIRLILTRKFPKSEKIVIVTTLILFLLINDYFIISFAFLYGFELQLGDAVEISPRALVVLKIPLVMIIKLYTWRLRLPTF